MSNYPLSTYSDYALCRMNEFFDHYRPLYQDKQWAEKRKAEVKAEIERRKKEDQEGAQ